MPSYTSLQAVQAEFKSVQFTALTTITSTDVEGFIAEEEAHLDGEISAVYSVPVTGSQAVSIMKKLATMRVKARILDILPVKTGKGDADQGAPGDGLREQVEKTLTKIIEKKMILPGATLRESSAGVKSYAVDEDLDHEFPAESDTDVW